MAGIMVVEDDGDIREALAELLRNEGYDVCEAANGRDALEQLEHMDQEPCLLLLDLMMPVMNGPELLRKLDQQHRLATLPVVVISASNGSLSDVPQAKRYIRKPPKFELLIELAEEFCGSCRRPPPSPVTRL